MEIVFSLIGVVIVVVVLNFVYAEFFFCPKLKIAQILAMRRNCGERQIFSYTYICTCHMPHSPVKSVITQFHVITSFLGQQQSYDVIKASVPNYLPHRDGQQHCHVAMWQQTFDEKLSIVSACWRMSLRCVVEICA